MHFIDLRSDVTRCFTKFDSVLFDVYTLAFVMLNCLIIVLLLLFYYLESERTKAQILKSCAYYEQ